MNKHKNRVPIVRLAGLILLLLVIPVGHADEGEARALLEQMRNSLHQKNFEGIFVYMNGKDMETMRVIHEGSELRGRSYVSALSGEAREVFRDSTFLTCITPENRTVFREPIRADEEFILPVPVEHSALTAYYHYSLGDKRRIAGMDCQQVRIKPLDDYRFGYEYCIEPDSGIPLRIATLDHNGGVMEQVMFTSITFPELIDQQVFSVQDKIQGYTVSEASKPKLHKDNNPFKFNELPSGFKVKSIYYQPASHGDSEFYQVILSDGLAKTSLFIASEDRSTDSYQGIIRSGAVHAMVRSSGGSVMTAVGEVPTKTLKAILSAVVLPSND
jgi:sigma-E factor negative regulatory protein RseB